MATVSRWRSSRPVRLRLDLVGLEVFLIAFMIFVAGLSELPSFVWFVLVGVSVVMQSVLFYNIGRVREKLER
jgi:hypothetical protein